MPPKENAPACAPTQNRSKTENHPTARLKGCRSYEDTPEHRKIQQDSAGALGHSTNSKNYQSRRPKVSEGNRSALSNCEGTSPPCGPRCGGRQMVKLALTAIIKTSTEERTVIVSGRDAWALQLLVSAGAKGCTPIDNPAPRWSGYVFNLRKMGFDIETVHEPHKGPFPGTHARYVLRSHITLCEEECAVVA